MSERPVQLDPRLTLEANSQRIDDLIYSALVRHGDDMSPVPELAANWTVREHEISFRLRNDVYFSFGRKVDPEDVIFTVQQFLSPTSPFASEFSVIQSAKITGPNEITLFLKQADATLMNNLNLLKILPRDKPVDSLLGSGPYKLTTFDENGVYLEKTPYHSHLGGRQSSISFKVVRDDNTRFLKMIKGDLDVIPNDLPEEKIKEIEKYPAINVLKTAGLTVAYVIFNLRDPVLSNLDLRRALLNSIKRDEIVRYKLLGFAQVANSLLSPANVFSRRNLNPPSVTPLKEQVRGEITLATSDQGTANALILAQQMESVGVKIKLRSTEWGTFFSNLKQGRFQMAYLKLVGEVDPDIYRELFSSRSFPPGRNRGYFTDPRIDELVEKGRRELNFARRKRIYDEVQDIVLRELPLIPLWFHDSVAIVNKRVHDFKPRANGDFLPLVSAYKE